MICEAALYMGLYLVCTLGCTRLVHVILGLGPPGARCCTLGCAGASGDTTELGWAGGDAAESWAEAGERC